jgi:hypothetical protein
VNMLAGLRRSLARKRRERMESSVIDTVAQELRHATLALGLFVVLVGPGAVDAQGTGSVVGRVTTAAATARPARAFWWTPRAGWPTL